MKPKQFKPTAPKCIYCNNELEQDFNGDNKCIIFETDHTFYYFDQNNFHLSIEFDLDNFHCCMAVSIHPIRQKNHSVFIAPFSDKKRYPFETLYQTTIPNINLNNAVAILNKQRERLPNYLVYL